MNQREDHISGRHHPVAQLIAGCIFGVLLGGLIAFGFDAKPPSLLIIVMSTGLLIGLACALWGEHAWHWLSRLQRWMDWLP
jgi:hypothetical protein